MVRKRLGCFTGPAIVAVGLTLLAIAGVARAGGGALFSSGALNAQTSGTVRNAPGSAQDTRTMLGNVRSHAELGGRCAACHPAPWEPDTMADRCMVCHTGIRAELSQPGGSHAVLLQGVLAQQGALAQQGSLPQQGSLLWHGLAQAGCRECHPEHRGPTAPLTVVKQETFPHTATGFALTAHQMVTPGVPFTCADCHPNDLLHFSPTTCTECHTRLDAAFTTRHRATYGDACLACHDGVDTYDKSFDHSKVAFKLDGRHASLDCGQCHTGAHTQADLIATRQQCADCHAKNDAHQGQLGRECGQCHSTAAWQPATIDHDRTGFRLTDKHATVACLGCHPHNVFKATNRACAGCHLKDDVHKTALGTECQTCHTAAGWTPANFEHAKSAFPLAGKHLNVPCADCHADKTFTNTPQNCVDCHLKDDVHQGKLGADCAACHSSDSWPASTFDHAKSAYPLLGKHLPVACSVCHADKTFTDTPQNCAACHLKNDAHAGRLGNDCGACHTPIDWSQATIDHTLTSWPLVGKHISVACADCHQNGVWHGTARDCFNCHRKDDAHGGKYGTDCGQCHTPVDWKQATFDHTRSGFPLTGRHAGVTCLGCHANGFAGTPTVCVACHQKDDSHGGKLGADCASCHNTNGWKPANFDHSRSGFPLTGAHAGVNCQACHANGFAGTPGQCAACHQKDDAHRGQFGTDCRSCHNTNGWKPANFDHARTGFPLTGRHAGVTCLSCHANKFTGTPTQCSACHQKDDAHGGQFGTDCGSCHSTNGWTPASFDHSRSGFPLTGRHAGVTCRSCHADGFAGTPTQCAACHRKNDAHGGKFGPDCGACHNTSGWMPANFDHSRSGFPLTGAHAGVTCRSCHANGFAGTPTVCEGCHHEPAYHAGLFPAGCSQCHNTSAWVPAGFNGSHTFPFGHGGANSCHTCHPGNLNTWTCSSCHADSAMASRHREVRNFSSNCIGCHPTGGGGGD